MYKRQLYDVADAVALVKKTAVAKFDETIEAHIRTGCDGRHADQQILSLIHIFCPNCLPGILAGVILAFTRAMGEFGATIMLAGNLSLIHI